AGMLLAGQSHAADLVPPRGYFAPVPADARSGGTCKAPPAPYTAKLEFRSKYEGSDKARSTLNPKAEKAFREKTTSITEMERGVSNMVTNYMRKGQRTQLECSLQWLDSWARANALLSTEYNHT